MAAFSSARSAYIRFSLAFSASSSRNRVTSETFAPPYLLRRWKKEAGYHLQARVEHACFRYQSMIGDRLRARSRGGRVAEAVGAYHVLNQMPELGRPESYSLGRCLAAGLGSLTVSFESCTSAAHAGNSLPKNHY